MEGKGKGGKGKEGKEEGRGRDGREERTVPPRFVNPGYGWDFSYSIKRNLHLFLKTDQSKLVCAILMK